MASSSQGSTAASGRATIAQTPLTPTLRIGTVADGDRIVGQIVPRTSAQGLPVQHRSVYGVTLASDFPFRWPLRAGQPPADVVFTCTGDPPQPVDLATLPAVHEVDETESRAGPEITYHRAEHHDIVRVRDVADHYVSPDRIVCHLQDPDLAYLVEIQLLGMVLALWLERNNTPTLHASTVVVDGRAVAFLGTKGGGKTTLAAGLMAAGHALLTDDLLALTVDDSAVRAQPGYPMLRLWPEQLAHFVGPDARLPLVHPSFTKRRVHVGTDFGTAHPTAAPLHRVYLPARQTDGGMAIEPVRAQAALIELVRHSFLREAVYGLGLAGDRLRRLAAALHTVDVRRLRYPGGFDRLPQVVAAVEADLTGD